MRTPYGLDILDNCTTCPVREHHLFCNLSPAAVNRLNEITSTAVYPRGAVLFIEGQQARGAFVLCTGRAKLSTTSRGGKTVITKISGHGDVLGLNATISKRPYEVTAEMMEPGQANFIASDTLLQFLRDYGEVAFRVGEQLSSNYYVAHERIRTLGFTDSPGNRFAKVLLSWSEEQGDSTHSQPLRLMVTHQEIAEVIGTTRETVTRLFSDFREKQLIQRKGSALVISDPPALEAMVKG